MYGLIFDLDGVITETSKYHFNAWQIIAEELGGSFSEADSERTKGVSRMDSLDIVLELCQIFHLTHEEKIALAERKNEIYLKMVEAVSEKDVLPGIKSFIRREKEKGARIALGSSSKSGRNILSKLGLTDLFDVIVDGNSVIHAKPDPEVFITAAELLGLLPASCIVIEDAVAGIEAAKAAGMHCIAIGDSRTLEMADVIIQTTEEIGTIDPAELLDKSQLERSEILLLKGVFVEKIWGGNRLRSVYGYDIPNESIGEYWAVSGYSGLSSEVINGPFKGMALDELWEKHPELFGHHPGAEFPILTKLIDAREDLSVQVHPDDDYAVKYENSMGKNECWYILEADEESECIVGHHSGTREELETLIREEKWESFLNRVPVKSGDFFFIPAGTIHSIGKNTLLLEIQQTCDVTYRLYDYDRLENGKKRVLHIEQSLAVIRDECFEPNNLSDVTKNRDSKKVLIESEYFTIIRVIVEESYVMERSSLFMTFSVISGEGSLNGYSIKKGDHFITPFSCDKLKFKGTLELIGSYI